MSDSSSTLPRIVIDAGIGIGTVLPVLSTINVFARFTRWRQQQTPIYAPSFWLVETTSVIRRYVHADMLTVQEGETAIDDLLNLGIDLVAIQPAHCREAFALAEKLNQSKAYDSFYLAIATELDAHLYTTDKRLVNGAKQSGFDWVHHIGEATV